MKQNRTRSHRTMNTANVYQPKYPNAADPSYFSAKALEILAACVSGFGAVFAMLFLVVI